MIKEVYIFDILCSCRKFVFIVIVYDWVFVVCVYCCYVYYCGYNEIWWESVNIMFLEKKNFYVIVGGIYDFKCFLCVFFCCYNYNKLLKFNKFF